MPFRRIPGKIRRTALSRISRRDWPLAGTGPFVSFTFDDFPQSALRLGGAILQRYGIRGTFYAAFGLMGHVNELGPQFCAGDLESLLRDGHELGSHTFSHLSCRSSALSAFESDVWKGRRAVEQIAGSGKSHHFSYPYGHATLRAKPRIGAGMSSSRGIAPGINESPVDLNLLRANSLYSSSFDLGHVERLLAQNEACRGWLIFYTHDIAENPSAFGCTPSEFESVVRLAVTRGAKVLPIGQVLPASQHSLSDHLYY